PRVGDEEDSSDDGPCSGWSFVFSGHPDRGGRGSYLAGATGGSPCSSTRCGGPHRQPGTHLFTTLALFSVGLSSLTNALCCLQIVEMQAEVDRYTSHYQSHRRLAELERERASRAEGRATELERQLAEAQQGLESTQAASGGRDLVTT